MRTSVPQEAACSAAISVANHVGAIRHDRRGDGRVRPRDPCGASCQPTTRSTIPGQNARLQIGALVYPRMILLDLAGPQTAFNRVRAVVRLVAKDRNADPEGRWNSITATATPEPCPADLDVLFVPGGLEGTVAAMDDPEIVDFLADPQCPREGPLNDRQRALGVGRGNASSCPISDCWPGSHCKGHGIGPATRLSPRNSHTVFLVRLRLQRHIPALFRCAALLNRTVAGYRLSVFGPLPVRHLRCPARGAQENVNDPPRIDTGA